VLPGNSLCFEFETTIIVCKVAIGRTLSVTETTGRGCFVTLFFTVPAMCSAHAEPIYKNKKIAIVIACFS
jgi:hypothetical protein